MRRLKIMGWTLGVLLIAQSAAHAAVSVYLSPEELSARSPLIVEARVVSSRPGVDPAGSALHTYVTLEIETTHRGEAGLSKLVLRESGGAWGDVVHQVDAVPVYRPGERVFVYLEPTADGALRTAGMFFGKFTLRDDLHGGALMATRDLEGQGTILGLPAREETLTRNDLAALAANVAAPPQALVWAERPPEWERLAWSPDEVETTGGGTSAGIAVDFALRPDVSVASPSFDTLSSTNPARWTQSDSGQTVSMNVEPGGNPLNDDSAAVAEIGRALAAWTDVPESRLSLTLGNTAFAYTGNYDSPASNYEGVNIVLFDDPYDDISDPTGCGGVLAIGGYWRSGSTGSPVNGVSFHPTLSMYVIFNNNFDCFLGNADNLAEVAAHEIGHGLGFGHSSVSDAIMRASAYGSRGPRLGDDDVDAAHCHYPHTLTLTRPAGGELWTAGASETIEWSATYEAGGEPGTVDIEYSTNGGSSWSSIVSGTANDGAYDWPVPDLPGANVLVRVTRPPRVGIPATYPVEFCSGDAAGGTVGIAAAPELAGSVGDGLRVEKIGGTVRVTWSASCSTAADDYALYEGSLAALRAGSWDMAPRACSAGADLVEDLAPGSGARYYLVAARAGAAEGALGVDSNGLARPAPAGACGTRETDSSCTP